MIGLSERLLTIANMIDNGETLADIGTDHGYLPIHLLLEEISPSVILADISKGSLTKAKENCAEYLADQKAYFREGDGLEVLLPGEVDAVVLAGIGGLLTIDILDWDLEKSHSFKKLILQPRNNSGALRRYLVSHGFSIMDYRIVPEGHRFSEILKVVTTEDSHGTIPILSEAEWEFPDEIVSDKNPYAKEYLEKCLEQEKAILNKITEGIGAEKSDSSEQGIAFRKERIERIEYLLSKVK
ncbi:MAG: SAM-dependent methyltransferase [Firmicutes bacterium]|nr:SAM-dependent methyltransferase [Bacillota bacterium]